MTTILREGTTLNTRVEIKEQAGTFLAYCKQDSCGETDILAYKTFKTLAGAKNWATKILA
jgi:hypothetical protein